MYATEQQTCLGPDQQPISRTYQYRKVMKPMLERKRRARINRCLDELKELMVSALQTEGENVSKLEKADILELTVRHLQRLRRQQRRPSSFADRFRAGFSHCASEVSRCLSDADTVDPQLGQRLLAHLGQRLEQLESTSGRPETPPLSPPLTDTEVEASATHGVWRPW
ncbi:enhancer of split mgamma protein-like [Neocloeon triangulifer]|uniref:enhancer of split mgamma protein-like n=1 Tax=Neocloeon triangulifer TaxID=2078957 RepID=UPI00286F7615|nr:enhancer of split mgamma protein-like [Neocloeon triangulifer]